MLQPEFDELIDKIRADDGVRMGCLAGHSEALTSFVSCLKQPSMLAAEVLLIEHNCHHDRIDFGIMRELGLHELEVVDLECGATTHNLMALFGRCGNASPFEKTGSTVAIRGLSNAKLETIDRIFNHWNAWRSKKTRLVLLSQPSDQTEHVKALIEDFNSEYQRVPPLVERPSDIPYEIHRCAQSHSGGLDQFELGAIRELNQHNWGRDIFELEFVISKMYLAKGSSEEVLFSNEDVENALLRLSETRTEKIFRLGKFSPRESWQSIDENLSEIDSRCTAIIGVPFLNRNNMPNIESPLKTTEPELQFLRLVSWAYTTLCERSSPHMKVVVKNLHVYNIEKAGLSQCLDDIQKLRTFYQHSMEYSSEHDQETLAKTNDWFRKAIGRTYPELSDFEPCINFLLAEISKSANTILEFLKKLQKDELSEATIIKKWKHENETSWPKHKIESLVDSTILRIGRSDLNGRAVTEKLLREIQQRLSVAAIDSNLEQVVIDIVENALYTKFKPSMPVGSKEIIALGVEPGPRLGEIIEKLRGEFDNGTTDKDLLLDLAREMI